MAWRELGKEISRPLIVLAIGSILSLIFLAYVGQQGISLNLLHCESSSSLLFSSLPTTATAVEEIKNSSKSPVTESFDRLLGGLLAGGFDETSCISRYQRAKYWKSSSTYKPSAYLIEKLRKYEILHQKCAPGTQLYDKSIRVLKHKNIVRNQKLECNYVVYIATSGLGNRLLSLISTFFYALLTDKVLLLKFSDDMHDICCEPFPNSSWILPANFPIKDHERFYNGRSQSFGLLLKKKELILSNRTNVHKIPSYAYLNLGHDITEFDKQFFCDDAQVLLRKVPWVFTFSNQYFAPGFVPMSLYSKEFDKLFPTRQTMFHHLARYLLQPTNSVWGQITRYYEAYLAKANKRLGLQVRVFPKDISFAEKFNRFLNCTLQEGLLPRVNLDETMAQSTNGSSKLKAVLVTSLKLTYSDKLRSMYTEHPTSTGEVITVFQPSHEEDQATEKRDHNAKALTEMYLLSFSDELVTTGISTFGYIAQGLGGLKPWIVDKNRSPYCDQGKSMEPCYHIPPFYDCKTSRSIDSTSKVPPLSQCEDFWRGLKIIG